MTILNIVQIIVGAAMLVFGVLAINSKKLINSVIFLAVISMLAVISFMLMRAPDVAITEAVIGSGLVTALFVFTLFTTKKAGKDI